MMAKMEKMSMLDESTPRIFQQRTFREGIRCRAVCFSTPGKEGKAAFKIGYLLWGLDIWINSVPVIKVLIGVNILNLILMWIVR